MIRAHMATYPARRKVVARALATIAPQVDKVCLVLNQYDSVPEELRAFDNVEFILPPSDLRDTGKFYPTAEPEDDVFLVDDDLNYAPNYVAHTLKAVARSPVEKAVYGYHGSVLKKNFQKNGFTRTVYLMQRKLGKDMFVDMLGTGTVYLKGKHLIPFEAIADAQRFTDIRFARWCQRQGLARICLNRKPKIITEFTVSESIYADFTQQLPPEVFAEVKAFGRKTTGVGRTVVKGLQQIEKLKLAREAAKAAKDARIAKRKANKAAKAERVARRVARKAAKAAEAEK